MASEWDLIWRTFDVLEPKTVVLDPCRVAAGDVNEMFD